MLVNRNKRRAFFESAHTVNVNHVVSERFLKIHERVHGNRLEVVIHSLPKSLLVRAWQGGLDRWPSGFMIGNRRTQTN